MYIERLHGEKLLLKTVNSGGGFTEFTVETTKRKDKKRVCTKARKGRESVSLEIVLFLFIFKMGWRLVRVCMIWVLHIDKSC